MKVKECFESVVTLRLKCKNVRRKTTSSFNLEHRLVPGEHLCFGAGFGTKAQVHRHRYTGTGARIWYSHTNGKQDICNGKDFVTYFFIDTFHFKYSFFLTSLKWHLLYYPTGSQHFGITKQILWNILGENTELNHFLQSNTCSAQKGKLEYRLKKFTFSNIFLLNTPS